MALRYEDFVSVDAASLAGRYLRLFWQPIYLSNKLEIARPVPVRVLDEDFTLYRGESGEAHLVAPRCPHRGLSLAVGRVCAESIECFYHGWSFAPDGRCEAQPAEARGFAEKVSIASYPLIERYGLVFVYLGGGQSPAFPDLNIYDGDATIHNHASLRPWSFFAQIENGVDETHFNFVHRRTKFDQIGMNDAIPRLSCEETEYGMLRTAVRGENVRQGHFLMPNWSLSSKFEMDEGWTNHVVWRVPVDAGSHISFMADVAYGVREKAGARRAAQEERARRRATFTPALDMIRQILAGEKHPDDIPPEHPDIILIQDGIACMGQSAQRDRSLDLLGASDRQVSMIRRIWNRELSALRDGLPLKNWQVPKGLTTTRGVAAQAQQMENNHASQGA